VDSAVELQASVNMGMLTMNMSEGVSSLKQGSAISPPLSGAAIDINGKVQADQGGGTYQYLNSSGFDYPPGTVLNLTINSSAGNATSSLTVPPLVTITAPLPSTVISAAAGFNVSWSYTGGTPSGVTIVVEDLNMTKTLTFYLSGATTNYTVGAGQCVTGTTLVGVITGVSAPIIGANGGSTPFNCMSQSINYVQVLP
jgi:hypothetical protein